MIDKTPRLLDFCCKAGGTSMGYHMAGFNVVGIDIEPQPNFPFQFYVEDVMKIGDKQINGIRRNFDALAGSPPCQGFGALKALAKQPKPEILIRVREIFEAADLPYIIENVPGAPLIDPVQVCGSALGLRVQRHRMFESNCDIEGTPCEHLWQDRDKRYTHIPNKLYEDYRSGVVSVAGRGDGSHFQNQSQAEIWSHAMGIDWMNMEEMGQAIPPFFTWHLGKQLIKFI